MAKKDHHHIGRKGEDIAAAYLTKCGYTIVARNWRWRRAEVDIIAQIDDTLVFVEVKTRSYTYFGAPETAITPHQELRLLDVAYQYCRAHSHETGSRIDAIAIVLHDDGSYQLEHFEDTVFPAFE